MKRFIAYLSILISVILGVVIVAKPAVQGINGGYDYDGSREFVYQIVNHGETIDDFDRDAFEDNSAVTKIAEEFENRLISYDVEKYDIVTEGNDKIRVRFTAKDDTEYGYISNYLTADGNLSLVTFDESVVFNNFENEETGDEVMFGEKDAYLTYKDSIYPGIVIPLVDAKTFNEKAVKKAEELNVPNEEEGISVSQEGNIYLWTRYEQGVDNFENAEKNENIKNKLMLSFQYNNIWFEENEEDYSSIVFYFNVDGLDENTTFETIDWNAVAKATETANYYLHLINASHLDQRVYLLSENTVDANLETLVNKGMSIEPAMSQTLIATVVAFVIILVISVVFFRLNGLMTALTSGLGALLTLFIYNALGATLSFPAILGFVVVSILTYVCGFTYSVKFSSELAKGKNSKKAFIDATRKNAFINIDLSVITLIAGIFIFLLGNSYISGCGIILFFGGLINLVAHFVISGAGLYFLSSSNYGMNKPALLTSKFFNKNTEKVETVENETEEKAEEETPAVVETKKSKVPCVFGGILGVVALACTIGLSVFAGISTPYKETATFAADSYAYVYVKKPDTTLNTPEKIEAQLDLIRFTEEVNGEATYKEIYTDVTSTDYVNFTNPDDDSNSIEFEYFIYSIKLNNELDLRSENFVFVTVDADNKVISASQDQTSLSECLATTFGNDFTLNIVNDFNITKTYNIGTIALVTFITVAVCGIYLFIRHGRFVAIIGTSVSSAFAIICLGLFSLLRTAVYNYIAYATIPAAILVLFIVAYMAVKYKEHINENKVKVVDIAFKKKIANESKLDLKNTCALVASIIILVSICYFGFSTSFVSNTFLIILFASLCAYLFLAMTFTPFLLELYDKLGNVTLKVKLPKSNKKRLKQQHKSRQRGKEVEEATFIGIND